MLLRFILLLLTGCTLNLAPPQAAPTLPPPEVSQPLDSWNELAPGMEQRAYDPIAGNTLARLQALRFDPALYSFRVHYSPGLPLSAMEWANVLPGAVAIVNANYFDGNNQAVGMVVTDGAIYGSSYVNRGGTFLVQNGLPRVRSNITEPYQGEPLEQAAQAFPMLVTNGLASYEDNLADRYTRRTVVAQDGEGRIIMMATPFLGLPLLDLSQFLPTADMGLINALNLDGGGSTLMVINATGQPEFAVTSLDPVPAVIAVYRR